MTQVENEVLDFAQKGLFSNQFNRQDYLDKKKDRLAEVLYKEGLSIFLFELKNWILKESSNVLKFRPLDLDILFKNNQLFVFAEDLAFEVFSFKEDATASDKTNYILTNIEDIKNKAFSIYQSEISLFLEAKEVMSTAFEDLIKEESTSLNQHYPLIQPRLVHPKLFAHYNARGFIFQAYLNGFSNSVYDFEKNGSTRFLKKEVLSKEQAKELIRPAFKKSIKQLQDDIFSDIKLLVDKKILPELGLSSRESARYFEMLGFSKDPTLQVLNNVYYVPVNISVEDLDFLLNSLKVRQFFNQVSSPQVAAVLKTATFVHKGESNFERMIISDLISLEEAKELVNSIEKAINQVEEFVNLSEFIGFAPEKDYWKSLYLKEVNSFRLNDTLYTAFKYRLPSNKKTRLKVFASGKECSLQRYYKANRKYKKSITK